MRPTRLCWLCVQSAEDVAQVVCLCAQGTRIGADVDVLVLYSEPVSRASDFQNEMWSYSRCNQVQEVF